MNQKIITEFYRIELIRRYGQMRIDKELLHNVVVEKRRIMAESLAAIAGVAYAA